MCSNGPVGDAQLTGGIRYDQSRRLTMHCARTYVWDRLAVVRGQDFQVGSGGEPRHSKEKLARRIFRQFCPRGIGGRTHGTAARVGSSVRAILAARRLGTIARRVHGAPQQAGVRRLRSRPRRCGLRRPRRHPLGDSDFVVLEVNALRCENRVRAGTVAPPAARRASARVAYAIQEEINSQR